MVEGLEMRTHAWSRAAVRCGFGLRQLAGALEWEMLNKSKPMSIEYQLTPQDFVAFAQRNREFIPQDAKRFATFGILPVMFVALSIATQSLIIACIFSFLYFAYDFLVFRWVSRGYY